jgi:hypothetical protein
MIVENEHEQVQMYEDVIASFNKTNGTNINPIKFYDLDQARNALLTSYYDAAIIDLKLSPNSVALEGMEIVDSIIKKMRYPVFIVSGSIGQVDKEETAFFKKRSRDGDFKSILQELINIYNTGITKILGKKGSIDEFLNAIFWNHLSLSINVWISDTTRTSLEKESALLRYTLLHMQEYITENIDKFHPNEFYITPPVKKEVFTGDIVEYRNQRCLILTPACDFVQGNVENVLFIKIKHWEDLDLEFVKRPLSANKKTKLADLISNKKTRYHFIPRTNLIEAGFIDFQQKASIDINVVRDRIVKGEVKRVATVSAPFLKDIISRYANYYSRQGSPDFITEEVLATLLE